jgi:hypothetical protein
MNHTLTASFDQAFEGRQRSKPAAFYDDPLGAARGIAFSTLASVLIFWLPLAYVLSH